MIEKILKNTIQKMPLRTILIVPFVIQITVAVGLVGYMSLRAGQRSVNDMANQLIDKTSDRIEQEVVNYLNKLHNTLSVSHGAIQSGNLDLKDFEKIRRYFWQVVHKSDDGGGYLAYGNQQAEYIGVTSWKNGISDLRIVTNTSTLLQQTYLLDEEGKPKELLRAKDGYDPRLRPWYWAAKQAGRPTWSKIYAFFSQQDSILAISSVYPIYNAQRELQGVLAIHHRVNLITDFINDLFISPNGQSFILERSGYLVAGSEIPQPFKIVGEGKEREIKRIPAALSDYPVVKVTAQKIQQRFDGFQSIGSRQSLKFQENGNWYYAQISPITDGRGIDWLSVIVVPEQDFMAQINQNTRNTILLCVVALGVAIAIGILTASWVTSPLIKITAGSEEIAKGNLDEQVDEDSPVIELKTLGHSFNSMARQLKESFETLEDKVKERTADLAKANEQITSLNQQLKAENLRMGAELDVARQIQQMVLPKLQELEVIKGIDLAGFMEPADEVGGDYYDVLHADGVVTIGIGDVTGHGLESGLLMLMTQTAVRTLQEIKERDPVRFLDTLNRTLYKNVQRMNSEKNLTLVVLNYSEGRVTISGQHEETLIVRAGGQIEHIDTMDLGLPIGMDDDIADFIDHTIVELNSGDGVVLYTDGIPEAFDLNQKQYGLERLCEVISHNWQHSAQAIKQAVIDDVRAFIGEQKVFDDITLVVLKQQ